MTKLYTVSEAAVAWLLQNRGMAKLKRKMVGQRRAHLRFRKSRISKLQSQEHCLQPDHQARLELAAPIMDRLEMLQGLHEDLLAVGQTRFANIERLCSELEQHLEDFKRLLEKKPRNDGSRQTLGSGALALLPAISLISRLTYASI
jgi:hypothetical protein